MTPYPNIVVLDNKNLTNPIQNVNKQEIRKYWSAQEVAVKIDSAKEPSQRMFLQFLWMTGVRISEAINVKVGDIDFQYYTITISWLKNRKYKYRKIPMYPKLRDLLQLYTAAMKKENLLFPFTRQRGWQIVQNTMQGHPHQLRHSFAVHWLNSGNDVVTLHRMMGHSKIQTTMEYLKIVPSDIGKELLKMQF